MQKDELSLQCFVSSQSPEQQSPLSAHSLPPVLQLSLSATHLPSAPQLPPQHASLSVHAWPSEIHWSLEQMPLTQLSEQQSAPDTHEPPASAHTVRFETQPALSSHAPEQHSVPPLQASPTARQLPAPGVWPVPAVPSRPLVPFELPLP